MGSLNGPGFDFLEGGNGVQVARAGKGSDPGSHSLSTCARQWLLPAAGPGGLKHPLSEKYQSFPGTSCSKKSIFLLLILQMPFPYFQT